MSWLDRVRGGLNNRRPFLPWARDHAPAVSAAERARMSSPSIERLARPYLFFVMVGAGFLVVASLLHVLLPVPLGLTFAELIVLGGLTLLYTSAMREEARWPSLRPPRVVWWSWPLLLVLGGGAGAVCERGGGAAGERGAGVG